MKDKLIELRNDLYNSLPVGKIDAFELTLIISAHLKRFDEFIDSLENTSDENNKPLVIANVSGQSEQLPQLCQCTMKHEDCECSFYNECSECGLPLR